MSLPIITDPAAPNCSLVRGSVVVNDPVVPNCSLTRTSPVTSDPTQVGSGLYQGNFVLMLILDETGSIGNGGAARGVSIIDQYGSKIQGIGWVSFGDIVCQQKAVVTDLIAARAELESYADGSVTFPFFQDDGGDLPENGVDAMFAGDALMQAFSAPPGSNRYMHMVTDTAAFAHNVHSAASVLSELTDGFYSQVFIENSASMIAEDEDDTYGRPVSVDAPPRLYRTYFPAGPVIQHLTYAGT